ncbi:hypothetical protein [Ketogulonicigenium vulgare]|uniref:hypothetical protein n=1 Tax=Ketogulonicigenium vulgare TaxID=92945 RepID=UPI00235886F6|nr:hypothetical protein [Ketogulonicigenium vulgare]
MILEITSYTPRDGMAEAVLAHRKRGCDVRAAMGLPRGDVYLLVDGTGPVVRWLCQYPDRAAFDADMAARALSPDFAVQREEMGKLIAGFSREVFTKE